ncbi:hypothetical protein GCM10028804_18220 [Larkinella terrae]
MYEGRSPGSPLIFGLPIRHKTDSGKKKKSASTGLQLRGQRWFFTNFPIKPSLKTSGGTSWGKGNWSERIIQF